MGKVYDCDRRETGETFSPVEWLAAPVTRSGEGYQLRVISPTGASLEITDEERRMIVACVRACDRWSTEELESGCIDLLVSAASGL